ncbi:MAG TPA: hypothetical protein VM889_03690 [Candidatus Thermoplasmatota archaeon]|nr:hypothetical protein [Candidatus Thermoplasmatota archaeon]
MKKTLAFILLVVAPTATAGFIAPMEARTDAVGPFEVSTWIGGRYRIEDPVPAANASGISVVVHWAHANATNVSIVVRLVNVSHPLLGLHTEWSPRTDGLNRSCHPEPGMRCLWGGIPFKATPGPQPEVVEAVVDVELSAEVPGRGAWNETRRYAFDIRFEGEGVEGDPAWKPIMETKGLPNTSSDGPVTPTRIPGSAAWLVLLAAVGAALAGRVSSSARSSRSAPPSGGDASSSASRSRSP